MIKQETVIVGGAIPYNNFKERIRIVKDLERLNAWIEIDDGIILYKYEEIAN